MVKLSSVERARFIGHLKAAWKQRDVAVLFGVSKSTISTHDVKDMPTSGRPRITTDRVDRSIRLARSLQMRYLGRHGRWVSVQTIRNQLNASQLKSRKAVQKPLVTAVVTVELIDDLVIRRSRVRIMCRLLRCGYIPVLPNWFNKGVVVCITLYGCVPLNDQLASVEKSMGLSRLRVSLCRRYVHNSDERRR